MEPRSLLLFALFACAPKSAPTPAFVAEAEAAVPAWSNARQARAAFLAERGIQIPRALPEPAYEVVRDPEQIAARLLALKALYLYLAVDESVVSEASLRASIERNGLRGHLTEAELVRLDRPRDAPQDGQGGPIFLVDRMWPLAWALGFEVEPPITPNLVEPGMVDRVVGWGPGLETEGSNRLLDGLQPRSLDELAAAADLFYCVNYRSGLPLTEPWDWSKHGWRSRSATLEGRLHALAWTLAPGRSWEDAKPLP